MRKEIERLENELHLIELNITKSNQLEELIKGTFSTIENCADVRSLTNAQLKRIIQKIEVDAEGHVDIYLRLFGDLGLDEKVFVELASDLVTPDNGEEKPFGFELSIQSVCYAPKISGDGSN